MNSTIIPSLEALAKKFGTPLDAVVATAIDFGIPIYVKTPDDFSVYATEIKYLQKLTEKDPYDFIAQREIGKIRARPYRDIRLLEIPKDHVMRIRGKPSSISICEFSEGLRFLNGLWQSVKPATIETGHGVERQIFRKFHPLQFSLHKKPKQEIHPNDEIPLIDLGPAETLSIAPSDLYINPDTIDEFWEKLSSITKHQIQKVFISEPLRLLYRAFELTWIKFQITQDNISEWPEAMKAELRKHSQIFDSAKKIDNAVRFIKPDDYEKIKKITSSKQFPSKVKTSSPGTKYQKLLKAAEHFNTLDAAGTKYLNKDIEDYLIKLNVDFSPSSAEAGATLIRQKSRDKKTLLDTAANELDRAWINR